VLTLFLTLLWVGPTGARDSHRVLRVVDGDTAVLDDGEVVRILSIDTPERGESLYHEASVFLAECVDGREVSLEFGGRRRDSYHRLLGHLWVGDTLVSEKLLEAGMARLYPFADDTVHLQRLASAQKRARESKCGIWQAPPPEPCSVYVIHPKSRRFHRPTCKSARTLTLRTTLSRDALLDSGFAACRNCRP
jgi:endonuclease YncB( thermonuclease family)